MRRRPTPRRASALSFSAAAAAAASIAGGGIRRYGPTRTRHTQAPPPLPPRTQATNLATHTQATNLMPGPARRPAGPLPPHAPATNLMRCLAPDCPWAAWAAVACAGRPPNCIGASASKNLRGPYGRVGAALTGGSQPNLSRRICAESDWSAAPSSHPTPPHRRARQRARARALRLSVPAGRKSGPSGVRVADTAAWTRGVGPAQTARPAAGRPAAGRALTERRSRLS